MDGPNPTVDVREQWALLIGEVPIGSLAFPNQPCRRRVVALVRINGAHLRVIHEPREVHQGCEGYGREEQPSGLHLHFLPQARKIRIEHYDSSGVPRKSERFAREDCLYETGLSEFSDESDFNAAMGHDP